MNTGTEKEKDRKSEASADKKKSPAKASSKTVRAVRKKTYNDLDAVSAEVESLQNEILESIVIDGRTSPWGEDGERARYFIPQSIPPLVKGTFYHIKDDFSEGIFVLAEIVRGRAVLFIFQNCVTDTKTSYTPFSIRDLSGKNAFIRAVTPQEASEYKNRYFKKHIIGVLGPKKGR